MQVKDLKTFRKWFKQLNKGRDNDYNDENFMGATQGDKNGFFAMYHGDKSDIYSFLRKEVEMAEDSQAIYEFVQNAADSDSTHFYMFHDSQYFMAINNGEVFKKEGVKSILNIGQSEGKVDDPTKIGRFGIGFKLVHRFVGKGNGLKELFEDYKGPQMLSWSKKEQLIDFMNTPVFNGVDFASDAPWFMKILITNFPATVGETVKDIDYNDRIVFPIEEAQEFQQFLRKHSHQIDMNVMNQGTIFFIKLGEGKSEKISNDQQLINNRLQNSLCFLKSLRHLQVNNDIVQRNDILKLEEPFWVNPEEEDFKSVGLEEKRDKEHPFFLQFGYAPYKENSTIVSAYPNFYKYFPMEDTNYGLNFIFQSNVFSIGSNRRHIHEDVINTSLLNLVSNKMITYLDDKIGTDINVYSDIFANILTSGCSNDFVYNNLLSPLFKYIEKQVPTANGACVGSQYVLIKNTYLECNPEDFGLDDKNWFRWSKFTGEYNQLLKKAEDKLGLEKAGIKYLLEKGDLETVNSFISEMDDRTYRSLLAELNETILPNNFDDIELIRLQDGTFISLREVCNRTDVIIKFSKIEPILEVLEELGFELSMDDFSPLVNTYNYISDRIKYLKEGNERLLFTEYLVNRLTDNKLAPTQKIKLFQTLQQFNGIGPSALSRELMLFCDINGDIKPLCEMLDPSEIKESWLQAYSIDEEELHQCLRGLEFLRNRETVYNDIIVEHWDDIIKEVSESDVEDFYKSTIYYYSLTTLPISLNSKAFVFTNEGFDVKSNVFYRRDLIGNNIYTDICEIVEESGYHPIQKSLLPYFADEPFVLIDSPIEDLLSKEITASEDAIKALFKLSEGKLDLFDRLYVKENITQQYYSYVSYSLCTNSDKVQYYSSKSLLSEYISEYFNDEFEVLPDFLDEFKDKCLRGEALYELLLQKTLDACKADAYMTEAFVDVLEESDYSRVAKKFIGSLDKIDICSSDLGADDFSYKVIKLIIDKFEIDSLVELKSKFYIDDVKLSTITANETIKIDGVKISMSNILTDIEGCKVVDDILHSLKKYDTIDNNKLKRLLNTQEELTNEDLSSFVTQMLETESYKLKNGDQIAFVLLLCRLGILESISGIEVADIDGDWQSLESQWFSDSCDFVKREHILDERYNERLDKTLLKGCDSFILGDCEISKKPNLIDQNFDDCLLDEDLSDYRVGFVEYIVSNYKDGLIKGEELISRFVEQLEWNPILSIISERNTVDDDALPEDLHEWLEEDSTRLEYLHWLGVQSEDSLVIAYRRSFTDSNIVLSDSQYGELHGLFELNQELILHTLYYLEESESELNKEQVERLCKYANYIDVNTIDGCIPFAYIKCCQNGDFVYIVRRLDDEEEYQIGQDFINAVKLYSKDVDGYFNELLDDYNLVNSDSIPEDWKLPLQFKELKFSKPKFEKELDSDYSEWDSERYIQWKENSEDSFEIRLVDYDLQQFIEIEELEGVGRLETFVLDYYYDDSEKVLYCLHDNTLEALKSFAKSDDNKLTIEGYIELSLTSNLANTNIKELVEENKRLRDQLDDLTRVEIYNERNDNPLVVKISENESARNLLKSFLEKDERFDCSRWNNGYKPSSVVRGVLYQGEECLFIVRSCIAGKLYFTPYEWTLLSKRKTFLALRSGNNSIQLYGIERSIKDDLVDNVSTININFDTEQFSREQLDTLCNVFVAAGVRGSGLVFDAPNSSIGEDLKGLAEINIGEAFVFTQDEI